ncbi:MAG: GNAT family N-acetyltransferase [Lachnospiraceae bacterium]|nr:GNAT family N-acetyltransferase [Lachnospiraceae bacterium]
MTLTRIGEKNFAAFSGILPYEKMPDDTENILMLGAIEEGVACGAAAVRFENDIAVLESVYVDGEHRRRGIGRTLITELIDVAGETGELSALCADFSRDEALHKLLEGIGFFVIPGDTLYYTGVSELLESRFLKKSLEHLKKQNIVSLDTLKGKARRIFNNRLKEILDVNDTEKINVNEKLSRVKLDEKESPVAFLLISDVLTNPLSDKNYSGNKSVLVSFLYSETGSYRDIQGLFASALTAEAVSKDNIETVMFYSDDDVKDFVEDFLGKPLQETIVSCQAVYDLTEK